ncbi:MAG: hypothetical protein GC161_16225 [Planctomycetaceae bacterium]|nr:hypothetical protein [Planctomycetaceae bacterium]
MLLASLLLVLLTLAPSMPRPCAATPPRDQTPPNFAQHHLLTVVSSVPGDRFASALAPAGDIDGDGQPDWWVGAPRRPLGAEPAVGHAFLVDGASGAILNFWTGDDPHGQFGAALASGASLELLGRAAEGDFDGDGVGELAAAAPFAGPGRVRVLSPGADQTLLSLSGTQLGERFGAALAFVGDLNGDGRSEIAVGAPLHNGGGLHAGRLTVHSGADGTVLWSSSGSAFDRYGTSVAAAGDLNGDGVLDLVVGAPLADESEAAGAFNGGAVWALSGVDGAILWNQRGSQVGEQLGQSLAGVADRDGDGKLDIAVGAPGYDAAAPANAAPHSLPGAAPGTLFDAGAVHLRSGASGQSLAILAGSEAGAFASTVGALPDLDGDGLAELALGSVSHSEQGSQSGQVRLFGSEHDTPLSVFDGEGADHWFGAALASASVTSGGVRLAVGAPGFEDEPASLGRLHVLSGASLALATDVHYIDPLLGGSQSLRMQAPPELGAAPYLLLGCLLSSAGPVHVDNVELPLGFDAYLQLSLTQPNAPPLVHSFGWLDDDGRANAQFALPAQPRTAPFVLAAPVGLRHAFLVFDANSAAVFASNAAPLSLTSAGAP